jgi:hypothetical protein
MLEMTKVEMSKIKENEIEELIGEQIPLSNIFQMWLANLHRSFPVRQY